MERLSVQAREGLELPELESSSLKDQDWGEQWKKHWSSFPLGRRFFVVPSWSDSVCPDDREPIYIDPGQAFGTGTHETTQLTIEAMEVWMEPRMIVLDLGTGSGILAIAAKLLNARSVHGCDTDPVAIAVARDNLERNAAQSIGLMCGVIARNDATLSSGATITVPPSFLPSIFPISRCMAMIDVYSVP